ncbi:MAG: hypothetical protein FWG25_08850, partial [Promicromonosporaceae bacterium]|nr:hypothetical protein [Promicromonosporaceae bacterium]
MYQDDYADNTPDVAGPETAIGLRASYDTDVDAAFNGDDAVTPGPLEDLDDESIADSVGPGVLDEPLGRTGGLVA